MLVSLQFYSSLRCVCVSSMVVHLEVLPQSLQCVHVFVIYGRGFYLTARFEWYYLLNCHHYTCFIADLLQSLVGVCVLSFDEEPQPGSSKAKLKSTCIDSCVCFVAVLLQSLVCVCECVCVCVCVSSSVVSFTKKFSKVWVMLSFRLSSMYLFHRSSTPVFAVCVCPLWWFIWWRISARFEQRHLLDQHQCACFIAGLL